VCCLIVVPLPPGKTPFALKTNNNNNNNNNNIRGGALSKLVMESAFCLSDSGEEHVKWEDAK
jgi:hypothetical protein